MSGFHHGMFVYMCRYTTKAVGTLCAMMKVAKLLLLLFADNWDTSTIIPSMVFVYVEDPL